MSTPNVPGDQCHSSSFASHWSTFRRMKSIRPWLALVAVFVAALSVTVVLSQKTTNDLASSEVKLVVDTDTGTDDAVALFYLLRAAKYSKEQNITPIKILGITCVQGNTVVQNVQLNVLKVLNAVDRLDIPVYKGAEKSLTITPPESYYFGADGMGDVPSSFVPDPSLLGREHAVNALIRLVNENPGQITLLALGPLTNIALAARLDCCFLKKLKKLIILGGSVEGKGNMSPGVEFNFYVDPEAVHVIFNGTEINNHSVYLLPWETALATNITAKWRKTVLGSLQSTEVEFINKIEDVDALSDDGQWQSADTFLAGVFLEDIIGRTESYALTSIMSGPTRGGIAVDYSDMLNSDNKIDIIYDINSEALKTSLINHFN